MFTLIKLTMVAVLGGVISLSSKYYSPLELQDSFEEGQRLYALGDFEKAIDHFHSVIALESNSTIDIDKVTVDVDEFILPVQVAGTYQIANSYNKLGLEKLRRSKFLRDEQKEAEAEERYEEALEDLTLSLDFFSKLAQDSRIDERTRVMAQYQMLETNYALKLFEKVIEEGKLMLNSFPNSVYEIAVHYDIGWSHFELGSYSGAIDSFNEVLVLAPHGSRSDRALYQIAESRDKLGNYDEAIKALDRLIGRYDFSLMSEQELIEMSTAKLKGLVEETSRELITKAQLKKGDILARQGKVDDALDAYMVIPDKYAAESSIVKEAYIRYAELVEATEGTDAALNAYKNAIEKVDDKLFQARTQLTVARLLFEKSKFAAAAEEYEIYIAAYSEVASRVGFQADKALFRVAQCYQAMAQKDLQDRPDIAKEHAARAKAMYEELLQEYPGSPLLADIVFSSGFVTQILAQDDLAVDAFKRVISEFVDHPVRANALLQLARLAKKSGQSDTAEARYLEFLSEYPGHDLVQAVRVELGVLYKSLGSIEQARQQFVEVEKGWKQWANVQIELVDLYQQTGRLEEAQETIEGALTQESNLSARKKEHLHYLLGQVQFLQDNLESAIENWSYTFDTRANKSVAVAALLGRGSANYELAKQYDAATHQDGSVRYYEAAIEDMKSLLALDPAVNIKDSAFRTLGAAMIRLNREKEAAEFYQELINSSRSIQERVTYEMLLTELYYDQEDFTRAERHAREMLSLDFEDDNKAGYYRKERAYSIIGNSLLQERQYAQAAEIFKKGLELYPNSGESANLAFSTAFALFNNREFDQALKSFEYYLDKYSADQNVVHGQYYLAHSHQALTAFDKAAPAFQTLADLYPDSSYEEEALYLVGENFYNERKFDKAAEAYIALLGKYQQRFGAAARYALAWSYFEQEDMTKGVDEMRLLVADFPASEFAPKAQFTIGDYYYNIQDYGNAVKSYSVLLEKYPDSEETPRAQGLIAELKEIRATLEYNKVMELFESEKHDQAIAGFKTLIKDYSGTYTELASYCNMGLSYEALRQWPEAVESYKIIIEKGGEQAESADVVMFAKAHMDWIVENRL